jgi:N-acetyl-anhydromuramyl-L-alanine amidase AmpD
MENHLKLTGFEPLGFNEKKKQIILCDTKRDYRNYINSLKYRYNGKNPYLPNFVIDKTGKVYSIIPPNSFSNFMQDKKIDKKSIIIVLENNGWLKKNPLDNTFINWVGDIYKKDVFEKKWREQFFWEPYTKKQLIGLSNLIKEMCEKFDIPKESLGHNVISDEASNFNGVVSKSNYDFSHKDVNPSFDFKLLKELLDDVK